MDGQLRCHSSDTQKPFLFDPPGNMNLEFRKSFSANIQKGLKTDNTQMGEGIYLAISCCYECPKDWQKSTNLVGGQSTIINT